MLYSKLQSYALMADWTRRESIEKAQETIFFFTRKQTSSPFYSFAFFKGSMSTIYVSLTSSGSINILVDRTSISCEGSLVTSARVTLHTHMSRTRVKKQNKHGGAVRGCFSSFYEKDSRST